MKAVVEVFTSPTCPHCPAANNSVNSVSEERDDFTVKDYSMATKEGQKKAQEYGVMSVPTVFVKSDNYPEIIGHRGAPTKKDLNKSLDIALGLKTIEKKKSLFQRLKEKLK